MDLQVVIPTNVLGRLRTHATRSYPEECCGILVGHRDRPTDAGETLDTVHIAREIRCSNAVQEQDRRRRFAIDPRALLDVIRELRDRDEQIVGFYHSHPDLGAELSPTDMTFLELWPETVWLILSVGQDGPRHERAWWLPAPASNESPGTALPLELPLHAEPIGALAS